MKLKLVKASQGWAWVKQGLQACRQQPLGYIGLLGMTSLVTMLLTATLRNVGLILVLAMLPSVWLGFMLATRRVLTGQVITPAVMLEPFKGDAKVRRELILLGLLYAGAMLGATELSAALGPDVSVLEDIQSKAQDVGDLLSDPAIQQSMLLDLALTVPITLLFLHTPALILWARIPMAKALFFSAVATWRNLGAFIVFGLGWFGVLAALALAASLLALILPIPFLVNVLTVGASMWLVAGFYGSLYFTVVDCFDPKRPEERSDDAPRD